MELDQGELNPFKGLLNIGLEFLFPSTCLICGVRLGWQNRGPVCALCWENVRLIQQPICRWCGYPIDDKTILYCQDCQKNPPAFTQARSVFHYEGTIRQLIHFFKYQGMVGVGKFLASHISQQATAIPADCIVPVPISIKKLRHREFNQSLVLANKIGEKLGLPVHHFALKRVKEVAAQMRLSREERMSNIKGAFEARKVRYIRNKRVLLVDDVITTGATASECTRVLLKHGANQVRVLTLAKTILSSN